MINSNLIWKNNHIEELVTEKAFRNHYFLVQLKRAQVPCDDLVAYYCACIYACPVFCPQVSIAQTDFVSLTTSKESTKLGVQPLMFFLFLLPLWLSNYLFFFFSLLWLSGLSVVVWPVSCFQLRRVTCPIQGDGVRVRVLWGLLTRDRYRAWIRITRLSFKQ